MDHGVKLLQITVVWKANPFFIEICDGLCSANIFFAMYEPTWKRSAGLLSYWSIWSDSLHINSEYRTYLVFHCFVSLIAVILLYCSHTLWCHDLKLLLVILLRSCHHWNIDNEPWTSPNNNFKGLILIWPFPVAFYYTKCKIWASHRKGAFISI